MGTRKKLRKNKGCRAVSPVIATVILVAIAITIAIAVAYWMSGISGTYTRFEQIELQNALCTSHNTPSDWNVTMTLKNTGTVDVTLLSLFINDVEVDTYGVADTGYTFVVEWATNMTNTEVITRGATLIINVYIAHNKAGSTLSPGTMVNVKIHSAGGMVFTKLVHLS
jgi:flagellin-like protein